MASPIDLPESSVSRFLPASPLRPLPEHSTYPSSLSGSGSWDPWGASACISRGRRAAPSSPPPPLSVDRVSPRDWECGVWRPCWHSRRQHKRHIPIPTAGSTAPWTPRSSGHSVGERLYGGNIDASAATSCNKRIQYKKFESLPKNNWVFVISCDIIKRWCYLGLLNDNKVYMVRGAISP